MYWIIVSDLMYSLLTPRSRVLREKLTVMFCLYSHNFMGAERSLPY